MYRVIKIIEFVATRTVELVNELTGNIDLCFDDSALISMNNFEFMKEGERYDCKIELFGELSSEDSRKAIKCKVEGNEVIGAKQYVKVSVDQSVYYIPAKNVPGRRGDHFWFSYTRKDLIQVGKIVHADLLNT